MIKRKEIPKIFFGWWTVLAGGIISLWAGGFHGAGFSALFKPISSELAFNRTVTSVAASIGRFEGGFEAPLSGWLTDRFGAKWIVVFGVSLISVGLILMYFVSSLWAFYLVWGLMLGTGFNILSVPLDTTISNWFVKKRGVALSIKICFQGLSGVLVLPLVAWLIASQGWRTTCVIGGVVMGLIGLPLATLFVKQRRPEHYGLLPDGATPEEKTKDTSLMIDRGIAYAAQFKEIEFTLRQAVRTPAYWLLVVGQASFSLAHSAIHIHGIPFLTDINIDPIKAASILAITYLASMPGRFVGGLIADRIRMDRLQFLLGVTYLLQAIGMALFLQNQTITMIYVWLVLNGLGFGAAITLMPLLRARWFGRKAFGSIHGTSSMFVAPAGVIAPIYAGWVYDTTGNYIAAFTLFAVLFASAAVLVPFARPARPPAHMTDIHEII